MPKRLGAVLFALVLVTAGCGGDDDDAGDGAAPEDDGGGGGGGSDETVAVEIAGFAFDPEDAEVAAGGRVTFSVTNNDTVPHTYTSDDLDLDVEVDPGDTAEQTVDVSEAGDFDVHCRIHTSMSGTITAS